MLIRTLFTLIICFLAVFQTGCDALEDLIPKGCNIEGYPKYNSANLLPCDDENGDGILNDCCGDFSEGCTDSDADNYVGDDTVASTASCEDCCIAEVGGCTDCGANNYQPSATDDDGSCTYDTAGCIDSSACCNIAEHASNDCSNVSGGDDTSCCSSTVFTTCYLDLNNNQIWEEMDNTVSTCDCGDLKGTGWVSEEFVSNGPEIVGCTEPVLSGADIGDPDLDADENYVCSEYGQSGDQGNEYANVDDGSCCINDPQPMSGFEEGSAELMLGEYNVIIQLGYTEGCNEDCCADPDLTEEEFGHDGPETRVEIMTLGLNGTFQHHEAKIDSISMRPEWEYRLENSVQTEENCENEASDADYWYCANWGFDYENCEDFTYEGDCPNDHCRWETNFCHPTFQGQPCHEIHMENECWDNGCEWDAETYNCFQPAHIPGVQCWGMNSEDCVYDEDCIAGVDCSQCDCGPDPINNEPECVGICCDGGGDGGDDGPPDCIMDCEFPDNGLDTNSGFELCQWITTTLWTADGGAQPCMDDCDEEYDDNGQNMTEQIKELAGQCEVCLDAGDYAEEVCNYMWDDMDGGGDCDDCDCSGQELDCWACAGGDCCNQSECADGGGGPDDCLVKDLATGAEDFCPGVNDLEEDSSGTEICNFFVGLVVDGVAHECIMDCDYMLYLEFLGVAYFCADCLIDGDCDDSFGFGNGFAFDPQVSLPDALALQLSKMQGAQNHGNYLSRSDGCVFEPEVANGDTLNFGFLDDCSGDGDCCPREWVGDGFADCQDQEYGCDLSCYDNDGGDCGGSADLECMPIDYCWYINDDVDCAFSGCVWNFDNWFCHPQPADMGGGSDCGQMHNQYQCEESEVCDWVTNAIDPSGQPQPDHCAPKPMTGGADCHGFNNSSSCNGSDSCQWDAPAWMEDWQTGACFSQNPCSGDNDPNMCENNQSANCEWDWEYNACVESGGGDEFCDCRIAHTERSCNDSGNSWALAPWCDGDDGCDEMLCMVSMEPEDCSYANFEFDDPCEASTENVHLNIEWYDQTCWVIKSRDNNGLWDVTGGSGGQFCVAFPYEPDPGCEDIYNPDECYCYDCEWNWDVGDNGQCQEWTGRVRGREKRLEQERNYQNVMYSLSNSCSELGDDQQDYDKMTFSYSYPHSYNGKENSIYLWSVDGEGCTEVILVPVGDGL